MRECEHFWDLRSLEPVQTAELWERAENRIERWSVRFRENEEELVMRRTNSAPCTLWMHAKWMRLLIKEMTLSVEQRHQHREGSKCAKSLSVWDKNGHLDEWAYSEFALLENTCRENADHKGPWAWDGGVFNCRRRLRDPHPPVSPSSPRNVQSSERVPTRPLTQYRLDQTLNIAPPRKATHERHLRRLPFSLSAPKCSPGTCPQAKSAPDPHCTGQHMPLRNWVGGTPHAELLSVSGSGGLREWAVAGSGLGIWRRRLMTEKDVWDSTRIEDLGRTGPLRPVRSDRTASKEKELVGSSFAAQIKDSRRMRSCGRGPAHSSWMCSGYWKCGQSTV